VDTDELLDHIRHGIHKGKTVDQSP
jgi:hypothetical protein